MAVFISRRHACDQAKLVHHCRGRNPRERITSMTCTDEYSAPAGLVRVTPERLALYPYASISRERDTVDLSQHCA
jgi:hypothetical protein